jgi:hypothetical protein
MQSDKELSHNSAQQSTASHKLSLVTKQHPVLRSNFWPLDPSHTATHINLLTPNVNYSGRTTPLTSKVAFYIFIQQI